MDKIMFEDRFSCYYREHVRFLLIQKYSKLYEKGTFIENVEVFYKGSTLVDDAVVIMQSLLLLERVTGKKSIVKGHYRYIGAVKKFFYGGSIILRKEKFFNFFNFVSTCCLPLYIKRNGAYREKKLSIKIKDLNIFYNFKILNFKGFLELKIAYNDNNFLLVRDLLKILKMKY